MRENDLETFYPANPQEWRQWLKENHKIKASILLVCYKKNTNVPSITHSEAVDEALCFGWIDGTRKSLDTDRFVQFFCKRKPISTWSKVNKAKIQKLIDAGLMTQAGLDSIEIAKQNGSWTILDDVEEVIIPDDLDEMFKRYIGSKDFFLSLSRSARKQLLQWLVLAKRPETRQKRIQEIAELAGQKVKPKQFT